MTDDAKTERFIAECAELADGLEELADRIDPGGEITAAPDLRAAMALDPTDAARLRWQAKMYREFADDSRQNLAEIHELRGRLP